MTETTDKLSSEIKHRTEVPFGNEDAEKRVYQLPLGKEYHLYIAHSEEDIEEAIKLCKDLERRFQLKCMISDRDFLVGSSRVKQMQDLMKKSVTILLLLSPAFFTDSYCVFEMELAVKISRDRNFSEGIIYVLSKDVDELPPLLKPYICIEAQKTFDTAAKINDIFCKTGIKPNPIDKLFYSF